MGFCVSGFFDSGRGCWLGRFVVSVLLVGGLCFLFLPVQFVGGGLLQVTTVLGSSVDYVLPARSGGVACTFDYVGVGEHQPIPGPSSPSWQQVLLNGTQQVFSEEISGRVHSDNVVDLYILNGNQLNVWVANRQPCNLTDGFIAFEPSVVDYSYTLSTLAQSMPNFKNLDSNILGVYFLLVNKSVSSSAHVSVGYQLSVVYGSSTITLSSGFLVSSMVTFVSVSSQSLAPFPTSTMTGGFVVVTTQPLTLSSRVATTSLTGSSSSSSQVTTGSMSFMDLLLSGRLNSLGAVAVIVLGIVVAGVLVKRRKRQTELQTSVANQESLEPTTEKSQLISSGYAALDSSLGGGLPEGYAIIILSPSFDERDLLIDKTISTSLSNGYAVFFVSRDISRTRSLADKYLKNFYAFNPQADKLLGGGKILKILGVENLNDVNISLSKAMEPLLVNTVKKILILDLLSDILLEHKALTTRKWLDEFVAKRKIEGFTVIATLNPLMVSNQERQTVIDLFDGVIEIYEKGVLERSKRYVLVRKMYGRKYKDIGVELNKDSLF